MGDRNCLLKKTFEETIKFLVDISIEEVYDNLESHYLIEESSSLVNLNEPLSLGWQINFIFEDNSLKKSLSFWLTSVVEELF